MERETRSHPTSDSRRGVLALGGKSRRTRSSVSSKAVARPVLATATLLGTVVLACGVGEVSTTEVPAGPTAASDTTSAEIPSSDSPPSVADQVLRGDGLGAVRFGEPTDSALPLLIEELGRQPTDDSTNLDAMSQGFGGTTVRFVRFGPLTVVFSDGTYFRNDQLSHFAGWGLSGADSSGLTTPEGITVGSTVADLQAVFGDQLRLFAEPDECTGTWLFSIGSTELGLEGELSGPPSDESSMVAGLGAGARSTC